MNAWVIDTNVLLIAEQRHPDVSLDCIANCVEQLLKISDPRGGKVVVDDGHRILNEYQHKLDPKRGKGVGSVFLKKLLQDSARRLTVFLIEDPEWGFQNFPRDEALAKFDPPDRKFVAAALACDNPPPILEAADSKWLGWASALRSHGVEVIFVCPADIERFRANKGA